MRKNFMPRIVVYLGRDAATLHSMAAHVTCYRGHIEANTVVKAFIDGADGVLVLPPCNDQGITTGIIWLMDTLGLQRDRFCLGQDQEALDQFATRVSTLGPNTLRLPPDDVATITRMASWLDALDAASTAVGNEEVPPSKAVIFSQGFRISVPYRTRVPAAQCWITADATTCVGCRICELTCAEKHEGVYNPELARIHVPNDPFDRYVPIFCAQDYCRQCAGAECLVACPTGALQIDPLTGARVVNEYLCIGCRSCQDACAYNMISFRPERNVCVKCNLCGGDPECVKACPAGALKYVNTVGV